MDLEGRRKGHASAKEKGASLAPPAAPSAAQLVMRSGFSPARLAEVITAHQVISFDVFDTLIAWRVAEPNDRFAYLGGLFAVEDFRYLRIKAEALARQRFGTPKAPEISLAQIYEILGDIVPELPVQPADELRAVRDLAYADPVVLALLEMARAQGKRVVAVDSSGAAQADVAALLAAKGVMVDGVYSAPMPRPDGPVEGGVFRAIAAAEGVSTAQILHFGDEAKTDVEDAQSCGATGLLIRARRDIAQERPPPFSPASATPRAPEDRLTATLIRGQIEAHLPPPGGELSDLYAFGYSIGGPLLAGFAKFIEEQARRDGIERLILLARDGYIVEAALGRLGGTLPAYSVLPMSRRMAVLSLLAEDREACEKLLLVGLKDGASPKTYFQQLNIAAHEIAPGPDFEQPMGRRAFLAAYQEQLLEIAGKERALLERYLAPWLGAEGEKTAVVDIGWGLTTIRAFDAVLPPAFKGYFVGKKAAGYHRPGLKGYLFDKDDKDKVEEALTPGLDLMELIFADTRPAFNRLSEEGGEIRAQQADPCAAETERNMAVADVRAGVLRFLDDAGDLLAPLTAQDLKRYCIAELGQLIRQPRRAAFQALGRVPHARSMGHHSWQRISELWTPSTFQEIYAPAPKVDKSFVQAKRQVDRYDLLAPTSLKRLAQRADLGKLHWLKEMVRHPLNPTHWLSLLRYARRTRKAKRGFKRD